MGLLYFILLSVIAVILLLQVARWVRAFNQPTCVICHKQMAWTDDGWLCVNDDCPEAKK